MAKKPARYQNCSICRDIPDKAEAGWKGGDLMSDPLPSGEGKLKVVGAPFFNDSQSYSHSCLKQCPQCGTYYDWSFEYEYLVNGTEDDITLTRLEDQEGESRAKSVMAQIKSADETFRKEASSRVAALRNSTDGKGIYGAANFLQGGQFKGHDLSFAVDALLDALIKVCKLGIEDEYLNSCASLVYFVLSAEVKESPDTARAVMAAIKEQPKTLREVKQISWISNDCRQMLGPER